MSNRVEELEAKVSELQAAVNGLTEELVETKERLRELEDAQADDLEPAAAGVDEQAGNAGAESDSAPRTDAESADNSAKEGTESIDREQNHSEILEPTPGDDPVGGDAGEQDAKTDDDVKGEGGEKTDEDGEEDESDIIVA